MSEKDPEIQRALDWYKNRLQDLRSSAAENNGKLPLHERWRCAYYERPYLLLQPNDAILERFSDVLANTIDITADGKVGIRQMDDGGGRFTRWFTEIIEETNWRGIFSSTQGSIPNAHDQIQAYFAHGEPIGVRMFKHFTDDRKNYLFKFSESEFVRDMYKYGRFRISPASYYSQGSLIRAIKDFETHREYRLCALNEALAGEVSVEWEGNKLPIDGGVVSLNLVTEDYYLFSSCNRVSRRMPTDFKSDAVLVIKERNEFVRRLGLALLAERPTWQFLSEDVRYFDPYTDLPRDNNQELVKHFAYAYQREHRCVLRTRRTGHQSGPLEPFFVELGSLSDISEVIEA